jgi:RNA polymerase sigma-70 factor (ECF subfamily)
MPTMATPCDPAHDLAAWATTGDRAALDRVLAAAADPAFNQARRFLGHAADAEDATQEALLQLMRSAPRFDPARPFAPWLATLVHNACLRQLRSERRRQRREDRVMAEATPSTAADPLADRDQAEAVRAAVADLPERDRAAIDLHYFAGLSQADTAVALGISENACAVRPHRARERLRERCERRGLALSVPVAGLLAGGQTFTAPPALAAKAAGLAAAGPLPATLIPLSPWNSGVLFVAKHPLLASSLAAGLLVGSALPLALLAAENPPPAPTPVVMPAPLPKQVPANPWFQGDAARVLPYVDPASDLRIVADLASLRRLGAQLKPTSLLVDPRFTEALARVETQLATLDRDAGFTPDGAGGWLPCSGQRQTDWLWPRGLHLASSAATALAFNLSFPAADGRGVTMAVVNPGRLERIISAAAPQDVPATSFGPFRTLAAKDSDLGFFGTAPGLLVAGDPAWLQHRAKAAQAPPPDAPLCLDCDLGATMRLLADLKNPSEDRWADTFFGAGWRTATPQLAIRIRPERERGWSGTATLRGLNPISPGLLASLLENGAGTWLGGLRLRAPTRDLLPADPGDRQALLIAGCDRQDFRGMPAPPPAVAARLPFWNGDLVVELRPGAPLPAIGVVIGLQPGSDPAATVAALAAALDGEAAGTTATVPFPFGFLAAEARPGRLAIASQATDLKRLLAGGAATPREHLTVEADLPAIARAWLPLLLMQLPSDDDDGFIDRRSLPPQAIIEHLPRWRMTWTATADGAEIRESGLPLTCLAAGLVATTQLNDLRTSLLTQQQDPLHQAWRRHRDLLAAAEAIASALPDPGRLPARPSQAVASGLRRALAPLNRGVVPDDASLDRLGSWTNDPMGLPIQALVKPLAGPLRGATVSLTGDACWAIPLEGDLSLLFINFKVTEGGVTRHWQVGIGRVVERPTPAAPVPPAPADSSF